MISLRRLLRSRSEENSLVWCGGYIKAEIKAWSRPWLHYDSVWTRFWRALVLAHSYQQWFGLRNSGHHCNIIIKPQFRESQRHQTGWSGWRRVRQMHNKVRDKITKEGRKEDSNWVSSSFFCSSPLPMENIPDPPYPGPPLDSWSSSNFTPYPCPQTHHIPPEVKPREWG